MQLVWQHCRIGPAHCCTSCRLELPVSMKVLAVLQQHQGAVHIDQMVHCFFILSLLAVFVGWPAAQFWITCLNCKWD
jgi:hypothetical protein